MEEVDHRVEEVVVKIEEKEVMEEVILGEDHKMTP